MCGFLKEIMCKERGVCVDCLGWVLVGEGSVERRMGEDMGMVERRSQMVRYEIGIEYKDGRVVVGRLGMIECIMG